MLLSYRHPELTVGSTTCRSPNHSVSIAQTAFLSLESVNSFDILSPDTDLEFLDSGPETERGDPPGSPHTATKQAAGLSHVIFKVLNNLSVT